MRPVLCLSLLLGLAACGKSDTTDVSDTDAVDSDSPVDSDTDRGPDTDADTDAGPSTDVPAAIHVSGVQACADPAAREVAIYEERQVELIRPQRVYLEGAGSAIADFDGDGRPDLIAVTASEVVRFRQSDTGTFSPTVILTDPGTTEVTGFFGASAADIDDDGDLDLLVTARGRPNHLLLNAGDGTFTDGTAAAGLAMPDTHHSTSASWGDLDGDGDLDLFVGGHGWVDEEGEVLDFEPADPSWLFLNDGDGTFTDASHRIDPAIQGAYTFIGGWLDADGDGDEDLYVVNDFGALREGGDLLINEGGSLQLAPAEMQLTSQVAGMGLAIGDLDGDGVEEIAVPAWRSNRLFQRIGGLWFEVSQTFGWRPGAGRSVGWGSEFVDVDNDGQLDLTTAYGYLDTRFGGFNFIRQPDAMYVQRDGAMVEMSQVAGFDDDAPHRSMNPADINRDGWMDFVKIGLDGVGRIYLSHCGEASWLRVRLEQPAPNVRAIGATVLATVGDRTTMRRLRAGGTGYGTSSPPEVHLGMADAARIDTLEVRWPDGRVSRFTDVDTRQDVRITRSE